MSCAHEESTTPNDAGSCVRCGRAMPPNGRDPKFEQDFLDHAAHRAGLGSMGFEQQVLARLNMVPGDDFLAYSLERFAGEIGQEGEDVAGWSVGAAQCHELGTLPEELRTQVLEELVYLAALGARVELGVRRLRSLLE